MMELLRTIQEAKGYDDLQPVLEDLSQETRRLAEAEHASAEKAQTIGTVLAEAHLLLNELTNREVRLRGTSRHAAARHMELEGRLREIGSVLDQIIKRVKA